MLTDCIPPKQIKLIKFVKSQVLTATSVKVTAFWDVAPCSLVEVDLLFTRAYCLRHQRDCSAIPVVCHL
jgi:hypothetical protein